MSELIQDPNNDQLSSMPKFIDAVDKMVYWSKLFAVLSWIIGGICFVSGFLIVAEDLIASTTFSS